MNLADNLVSTAARYPTRVALRTEDAHIDYMTFHSCACATAVQLRAAGVFKGAMVGLVAPNGFAFPIAFYAALMLGATTIPMNPVQAELEFKYCLEDTGAVLVVVEQSTLERVEKVLSEVGVKTLVLNRDGLAVVPKPEAVPRAVISDCDGGDTALVLYTSGSTGKPKGVMLTHENLRSNAATTAETLIQATPDDVLLGCLPLFHVFALSCVLNASIVAGASVSLMERFDSEQAIERIGRDNVTIFTGVPTMYVALLASPLGHEPRTLRTALCGGAPMPVEVIHEFERRFQCPIYEGYALSETSPVACFNRPEVGRKVGSIGLPVRGMEMRVIDEDGRDVAPDAIGEIAIRGEGLMKGYLNRPDATEDAIREGWFRSGDLARIDSDGFFYIVDNKKRMIVRGGYNVYPREVEDVLHECPAVKEVAVVGVRHPFLGEEVAAAVVLRQGQAFSSVNLLQFCKDRLSPNKYPRIIWQVESLPKSATGKILHREVEVPAEFIPVKA